MDKVMLTVQRYGNMSAATVPVALVEALEEGRVKPGALILMPGFGAGLTLCAHLVRWGDRVTPLGSSPAELPPLTKTALELVNEIRAIKAQAAERSGGALQAPKFAETLGTLP
jgi:3-oxoacyl-[acyl-carrier-protein] synthase-3